MLDVTALPYLTLADSDSRQINGLAARSEQGPDS